MARIIFGSCMVRYPLGGNLSCVLQWLRGFRQLGYDVYFVEKADYDRACFDPVRREMTDDCTSGVRIVRALLDLYGMADSFCFVDAANRYYGMERRDIEKVFATADAFLDMGTHGSWLGEAATSGLRVLIDGEPGYTQIKMVQGRHGGWSPHAYDRYYSNGANVGTPRSSAPDAGEVWAHVYNPVVTEDVPQSPAAPDAPLTTVMNWQSHDRFEYEGNAYGQKDIEFEKFLTLPRRTNGRLEIAVAGNAPWDRLATNGWKVVDAIRVTSSYQDYRDFLSRSQAEFSVAKNVFVAMHTGWFSDRSAAYLASGRPVILQDTGFSAHLPCGLGLFAISSLDEAAAAIDEVLRAPALHARAAREIASEHLDARRLLSRLLQELGL